MGELGFMGMMVDTKYGGGGMDAISLYCHGRNIKRN